MCDTKSNKLVSLVMLALLSSMVAGCVFVTETHVTEEPFPNDALLRSIPNGGVTRQNILREFGPPMDFVKPENIVVEQEEARARLQALSARLQAPLVYYYENTSFHQAAFGIAIAPVGIPTPVSRQVESLWILIDERSGTAVDYVVERKSERVRSSPTE